MSTFAGFVPLGSTIDVAIVAKNTSNVPTDADSFPTYRIYGPAGFTTQSGSLAFKDTNSITGVTAANPTVYTSAGHNLTVGTKVTISGVAVISGVNGYNGTFNITAVTTNTFSVAVDNTLSGTYLSGGTWHVTGLYDFNYTPTIGNNFASGTIYTVFVTGLFSTVNNLVENFYFQVT